MNQYSTISNCIAASAGTGKTYRLVSRYIALLCLGERADSLIALTFTNKAAGEFRNRILDALAEGAAFSPAGESARNPLAARVVETVFGKEATAGDPAETIPLVAGITPHLRSIARGEHPEQHPEIVQFFGHPLDSGYFCTLLEKVIAQMAALQLSTLDSFFQKLVSQHRMELGLGEVTPLMNDEEAQARREALLALVDEYSSNEESRKAFIELCRDVTNNNLKSIIDSLSRHIAENYPLLEDHPHEADWCNCKAFGLPDATLTPGLSDDEWAAMAEKFGQACGAVAGSVNKSTAKALARFWGKMENGDFENLATIQKYLANDSLDSGAHTALKELIRTVMQLTREQMLRSAQLKTRGMYKLLKAYRDAYNRAVMSTGRMTFGEMTRAALQLFESGAAEELNQRYRHWLLDEFQDTNRAQWNSLKGLLDEVVMDNETAGSFRHGNKDYHTSERSLFVVGDRKQGIYGFRGSVGQLFSMLHGDEPAEPCDQAYQDVLVPSSLSLSYRSARSIMGGPTETERQNGLINTLFSGIQDDGLQDFRRHNTTRKARGYVQLRFMPPDCTTVEELRTQAIPAAIEDILRQDLTDNGESLKKGLTVAVLVRTNDEAAAIVNYLHQALPKLPVQLVGSTEVAGASALGEILMSLFLWLNHPADSYRMSIVKLSPLGAFWQEGEDDAAVHARLVETLDSAGYTALLRERALPLFPEMAHDRAFDEWLAAAVEFDVSGGSLAAWIEFMRGRSVQAAASTRAVQVMTIHKSKGLEFGAVILPFSRKTGIGKASGLKFLQRKDAVMALPDPAAFADVVAPELEAAAELQKREAYNLLYVACSRAKYANYLLMYRCIKEGVNTENGTGEDCVSIHGDSEAAVVARSLFPGCYTSSSPEYGKLLHDDIVYEMGTRDWYAEVQDDMARQAAGDPAPLRRDTRPAPLGSPAARRQKVSPSKLAEDEANAPAHLPATDCGGSRSAADFGTAVHALFEQVEWLDGAPLPFKPGDSPEAAIVCSALQEPGIAALFRRNGDQVAYAEQDIDAIDSLNGKEVWISGTIDRLVLSMQGGSVVAAGIIDYKTDKRRGTTPQEQDAALRERHFPQMKAYHNLITTAFNLPSHKVTVTLVSCPSDSASPRAIPYPPDTQW